MTMDNMNQVWNEPLHAIDTYVWINKPKSVHHGWAGVVVLPAPGRHDTAFQTVMLMGDGGYGQYLPEVLVPMFEADQEPAHVDEPPLIVEYKGGTEVTIRWGG